MGMWSKRGALACLVVGLAACAPTMEPYTPTSKSVDQDPDKLYAAAVRVFLRRGWGFQSRDPQARAVETGWFPYAQLRIAAKPKFRASFRVIISRGLIEVFTSCGIMTGATVATGEDRCGSERPIGINVREQELVADILQEVQRQGLSDAPVGYATAPVGFAPGYAPAPPAVYVPPPPPGYAPAPPGAGLPPVAVVGGKCATSSECTGDLVCIAHHCQPPPGAAPPPVIVAPPAAPEKCATSSECTGELVCIAHRCVAPGTQP